MIDDQACPADGGIPFGSVPEFEPEILTGLARCKYVGYGRALHGYYRKLRRLPDSPPLGQTDCFTLENGQVWRRTAFVVVLPWSITESVPNSPTPVPSVLPFTS